MRRSSGATTRRPSASPATPTPGSAQAEKGSKEKKGDKLLTAADSAKAEAEKREDRARKAKARPLFTATEPLEFTLIANYGAISRDRDTLSTKRFDGVVVVNYADRAPGESFAPSALAALTVWGLLGLVVALRRFRWEPREGLAEP